MIVLWRKAKKAYNAEVVDSGSLTAPQQAASNDDLAEPALGAPSTSSSGSPSHEDRHPALIAKMEAL